MTHHAVVSKAGGATTPEAINALCPMVVSQVVPGPLGSDNARVFGIVND